MLDEKAQQKLRNGIRRCEFFRRSDDSDCLIVFTHGMTMAPENYEDLLIALMKEDGDPFARADLLPYRFRATLGANTDLTHEAVRLDERITELFEANHYKKVILVGHSIGGMLVRRTVLAGRQGDEHGWTSGLDRLVLLASANRGFVVHEMYKRVALLASRLIGRSRLLADGMRGSKWMNDLRLGWILTFDRPSAEAPFTIQLRGENDAVVSKYDSMDLYRFPNSVEIELEGVQHADFAGMTGDHSAYEQVRDAFTRRTPPRPAVPVPAEQKTRKLIFLIHGIRDFGEWQDTLAYEIQSRDPESTVVSVRYGYFNIFQFLLPFQRTRAVRSFVDRYIQEMSKLERHARVEIAIAAHSNGTYVLANAMKSYPQIVANRIYLAGSVLPRKFGWDRLSERQLDRLEFIRNDCANWDWPVGILCNGLRPIFFRSLGTAGYSGFKQLGGVGSRIKDNLYLQGGHGAAFTPNHHAATAGFLLDGNPQQLGRIAAPRKLMNAFHYASWGLIPVVLGLLAVVYLKWIPLLPSAQLQVMASAVFTLLFIVVLVRI